MNQDINSTSILALDVGSVRIGLSIASSPSFLISLLPATYNDSDFLNNLNKVIEDYSINTLVVGLPRNMSGEKTKQSEFVEKFVDNKLSDLGLKIIFQDESLTSVKAEDLLKTNKKSYTKSDIDSVSASFILEDYLSNEVFKN